MSNFDVKFVSQIAQLKERKKIKCSSSFAVYLTEEIIEMSERFSPIFQALEFGTDNNATTVDMIVAVMEYIKTKVSSSGNSFKICTCEMKKITETF